jgi:hypothetical protein
MEEEKMKNKVLIITVITAVLIIGGSFTVLAEGAIIEDGKGSIIDRSIFEPFREKLEALKLKREEVHANRTLVKSLHDEWLVEIEEFRANRDALKDNPEMLTEEQKTELRTILEALNAENGARKTLMATRGVQIPRIEAIKELRRSFRESPSDEPLDAISLLYDEVIGTQGLRINLIPEALDLIKAANAIFEPTL